MNPSRRVLRKVHARLSKGRSTRLSHRFSITEPERVPRDTDYSSVVESDAPIVVQHTRLDSRQAVLALLSTIAFPGE